MQGGRRREGREKQSSPNSGPALGDGEGEDERAGDRQAELKGNKMVAISRRRLIAGAVHPAAGVRDRCRTPPAA